MAAPALDLACPPAYATRRVPSRGTYGGEVAEVMRLLGFEPMPWQAEVLDVALEHDDDGDLVYREVVLVVARQAGKTAMKLAVEAWRALMAAERWGPQRTISTMQTRNDSRKKFLDEELPMLKRPFGGLFEPRTATGAESLTWRTGSLHSIEAPNKKAGHGKSIDQAMIDEAFALEDDSLEQGVAPTMITRRSPQTWIMSAIGDDRDDRTSGYLKAKQTAGRAHALAGVTEGTAYFEWSAEDGDPSDPATWRRAHPAVGHTITEKALRADYLRMTPQGFQRAYLCRWPGSARVDAALPAEAWTAAAVEAPSEPPEGRLSFALDVSTDRSTAALAAAWERGDGTVELRIVNHEDGTGWVIDTVMAVLARRPGSVVGLDTRSGSSALIPDLERAVGADKAGETIAYFGANDVASAAGLMFDLLQSGRLRHSGQPELDAPVAACPKRPIGDRWGFAYVPGVDITPLRAASLALWAHTSRPAKKRFDWSRYG